MPDFPSPPIREHSGKIARTTFGPVVMNIFKRAWSPYFLILFSTRRSGDRFRRIGAPLLAAADRPLRSGCAWVMPCVLSARLGACMPGHAGYCPIQRTCAAGTDREPTSRHRVELLPGKVVRMRKAPYLCRQADSSCQVCTTVQPYLFGKWYRPEMFRRRHAIAKPFVMQQ